MAKMSLLLVLLAVCGCRKAASTADRGASPLGQVVESVAIPGSTVQEPGFDVAVRLSPRAKAALVGAHETVIVDVAFVSGPKPGAPAKYIGRDGEVLGLGSQGLEVAPGEVARFRHLLVNRDALAWVQGAPQVLVNVYSGRKASKDNVLDCGVYEGPLSTIANSVLPIDCKLIAE